MFILDGVDAVPELQTQQNQVLGYENIVMEKQINKQASRKAKQNKTNKQINK